MQLRSQDANWCWLNVECSNDPIFKFSNVQMFQCSNVPMIQCSHLCFSFHGSQKFLVHWSIEPLDHWSIGPLDHWTIGLLRIINSCAGGLRHVSKLWLKSKICSKSYDIKHLLLIWLHCLQWMVEDDLLSNLHVGHALRILLLWMVMLMLLFF